jgi:perosamine synthetase
MNHRIAYTKPSVTELEVRYVLDAVTSGWGENCYGFIREFEKSFQDYLGVKHAMATSSCTGALHLGLAALGLGPRDEVIMADTNWIATVAPIMHLGAKPVFVDILADTWCVNPDLVESAITDRTKAIIATHLYGNVCDMTALIEIGKKYNVEIIEDAAEAIGSAYGNQKAGSMGRFGVFSFHGTKTLTTGEGGMFVTNDSALYAKATTLNNHGRTSNQSRQFWPELIGFKFKMSNLQAAIGLAQLQRIDDLVTRKQEILAAYREGFGHFDCIAINPEMPNVTNGAWMPNIVFSEESGITRERLIEAFLQENIDARVFFWPLSSLPMFGASNNNLNSRSISGRAINLPSFHDMSEGDISRVVSVVKKLLKS